MIFVDIFIQHLLNMIFFLFKSLPSIKRSSHHSITVARRESRIKRVGEKKPCPLQDGTEVKLSLTPKLFYQSKGVNAKI